MTSHRRHTARSSSRISQSQQLQVGNMEALSTCWKQINTTTQPTAKGSAWKANASEGQEARRQLKTPADGVRRRRTVSCAHPYHESIIIEGAAAGRAAVNFADKARPDSQTGKGRSNKERPTWLMARRTLGSERCSAIGDPG